MATVSQALTTFNVSHFTTPLHLRSTLKETESFRRNTFFRHFGFEDQFFDLVQRETIHLQPPVKFISILLSEYILNNKIHLTLQKGDKVEKGVIRRYPLLTGATKPLLFLS